MTVSRFEAPFRASTRRRRPFCTTKVTEDGWRYYEDAYLAEYTPLTTAANLFSYARAKQLCSRLDPTVCQGQPPQPAPFRRE